MSLCPAIRNCSLSRLTGLCTLLITLLGGTTQAAEFTNGSRSNWAVKAYIQNRDAVVCIQGDKIDETGSASNGEVGKAYNGMGTGIIIDERGYIITNYHVVEGIGKIQVTTSDRTQYIAQLVARDTDTDLAVIKVNARKSMKPITLGRSDDLMPGEYCLAIGNPYGYEFSLTDGKISGIGREIEVNPTLVYRDAIQTNAEINPGNSGGPLLNVDGEMIGINAAIRTNAAGIAFAIPVNQVVQVAGKLLGDLANQSISHGIKVYQSDDEPANTETGFAQPSGKRGSVVVQAVEKNSPAAQAGIKTGDIIRSVGKYPIGNVLDFSRAMLDVKENDDLSFSVVRNSEATDLAVSMGAPKAKGSMTAANRERFPAAKTADITPKVASQIKTSSPLDERVWNTIGIRYVPIPKEEYRRKFEQFLHERPHGGVVVKQVRDDSPISEVGVQPGDVIVGIHEWVTTSENDVRYIARNWQNIQTPDGTVKLLLFRGDTPYFTELPLK